jgi:hypothetical protein
MICPALRRPMSDVDGRIAALPRGVDAGGGAMKAASTVGIAGCGGPSATAGQRLVS